MLFAMFLPTWRPKTLIFIYLVFSIFLQSPQDNPIYKNTVNNVSARQKLQKPLPKQLENRKNPRPSRSK
jgi:hypothetical protein